MNTLARCLFRSLAALAGLTLLAPVAAGGSPSQTQLDLLMFSDPRIELAREDYRFREGTLARWLAALESPEGDLRQQAQRALAWAHRQGLAGADAAIGPLTQNLVRDDRLVVRLTAAQALVTLDARQASQALFDRAQADGWSMAQLVEPALGRWEFSPLLEVWRRRLPDHSVERQRRLLAIRGLGELRDEAAVTDLLQIAETASQPPDLRWAAATALGQIRRAGLETIARQLAFRQPPTPLVDRLVAVRLLRSHDSPDAQTLLVELVGDQESTVVAGALERLLELDPPRIVPLAESALARGDVNVRRLVARALLACPSSENIRLLSGLLADVNPSLRDEVRRFLEQLGESADWRAEVIACAEPLLKDARWTVLEQCLVLLATLEVDATAERMLELLLHPRPEVYIAAAWGLRRLGAERTLQPALETARIRKENRAELLADKQSELDVDEQLAHLCELFGQQKYQPAEPLLRSFIEKDLTIPCSRSAAIWALGFLHEGQPPAELVAALEQRIKDTALPLPEHDWVRRFSAVALGRMKAAAALETLQIYQDGHTASGYACAWAISQITGQPLPPPATLIKYYSGFFLEPTVDTVEPQ